MGFLMDSDRDNPIMELVLSINKSETTILTNIKELGDIYVDGVPIGVVNEYNFFFFS